MTARLPATTLRFYRSADATITNSDTLVGTAQVRALSASGNSRESIPVTAPSTAGEYYYGACVDAVTNESDTNDNCSVSVRVDVSEPSQQTAPNLSVSSPSVDNSSPTTGALFSLSATVSNTGDGEAAATTLRFYRSADATITNSDKLVGTAQVSALSASGNSRESIPVTAPTAAGEYYYGACVDAVTNESDTNDNCSAGVLVTVRVASRQVVLAPNLEVGMPTVSDNSPATEAPLSLSATVSNTGDGEAAATTLRFYRSADATITISGHVGTHFRFECNSCNEQLPGLHFI